MEGASREVPMIPQKIDAYLREHSIGYEHRTHLRAVAAQQLAAAEHVSGKRIAKPVVVSLDGWLALAVVSAQQRVDLGALASTVGASKAELVPESMFAERFWPCEAGAEPPLGLFGLPIYVDAELAREPFLVMRAGTHEDAIEVETRCWLESEHVRLVPDLGAPTH